MRRPPSQRTRNGLIPFGSASPLLSAAAVLPLSLSLSPEPHEPHAERPSADETTTSAAPTSLARRTSRGAKLAMCATRLDRSESAQRSRASGGSATVLQGVENRLVSIACAVDGATPIEVRNHLRRASLRMLS